MAKITWHTQAIPGWLPALMEWSGAEYIKLIDPPEQNPFPTARVIGRTYLPDDQSNAMIWEGVGGADKWFLNWRGFYESRAYVWAWEAPNEPQPMSNTEFVKALNAFTLRLSELMSNAGLRLVGMNWGVGWPRLEYFKDSSPTVVHLGPAIEDLAQRGHILGLHEYCAPEMWSDPSDAHTLRYRHTVAELEDYGFAVPPIIVGECGIDGGVLSPPQPKTGWRTHAPSWAEYLDQLKWYDQNLAQDDVVAATIFVTGANEDWTDFEVGEAESVNLAEYIAEEPPPPPVPTDRAKGIDVSWWQGENIDWEQVAASGVKFAMIRASFATRGTDDLDPGVYTDSTFARNYEEAGKYGILRGVYHYLIDGIYGQALAFATAVGDRELELGYWADVEDDSLTCEKVKTFLAWADTRTGETVNVYTRKSFFDNLCGTPDFVEGRKLWVADWRDVESPAVPSAWDTWEFWQYSSKGTVPGIPTATDLNWFNGTEEWLIEKYGGAPPVPTTLRYFNSEGDEISKEDWEWIFGPLPVEQVGDLRLTEAHDSGEPAGMDCQLHVEGGFPLGARAYLVWSTGEAPAALKEGYQEINFDACYTPPDLGPYSIEIRDDFDGVIADRILNTGWLCFTEHQHPQKFVWKTGAPGPEPETYALEMAVAGAGQVVVSPIGPYEKGTLVTLSAIAHDGWYFDRWLGDVTGNDNPASLVMDSDKEVCACFEETGGDDDLEQVRQNIAGMIEIGLATLDIIDGMEP